MKTSFEYPVAEFEEKERVIRVSIPGAVVGGATAYLGYQYLAHDSKLPELLTDEVLGDVVEETTEAHRQQYTADKDGGVRVNDLSMLLYGRKQQIETFVVPLDVHDLSRTADEIHQKVTEDIDTYEHNAKAPHTDISPSVKLEIIDGTYSLDPSQQLNPREGLKGGQTYSTTDLQNYAPIPPKDPQGFSFEAYMYQTGSQTNKNELAKNVSDLHSLVQAKFSNGTVDKAAVPSAEPVPFTAHQFERLIQLAQDNGYGTVNNLLANNYKNDPHVHDQVNSILHEEGILVDQPSVLVRVAEQFPKEDGVDIHACQLEVRTVVERYHQKDYDPAPIPLGIISVIGLVAGGIRLRQRRRALTSERLKRAGLDGPAPSDDVFEAVTNGTANTRQKLSVLKYQKAAELSDEKGNRLYVRRLFRTGFAIGTIGVLSMVSMANMKGEKPDARVISSPQAHIVKENNRCSSSDNVAVISGSDKVEVNYFVDDK